MIICCGEALIDMARVQVRGFGEVFAPFPGGSPYNTAIAVAKLGVPAKFLGRLSTDYFGEILFQRLKKNRVGLELVNRSGQNSTLAFVKPEKAKDPQYIFYAESSADRSLQTSDLPPKLPADTKCIQFGSISMTMDPIASAIESLILREGTRKSTDQMDGAPVISFDPNIRPFMIKDRALYIEKFEKWIAASTIAKISFEDFGFIYPKMDPEKALQKVLSMGPWLAICTMGAKGALAMLRRNDGSVIKASAPGIPIKLKDTIGAGDTFHGAFLSWLEMKGKMSRSALAGMSEADLYNALLFANKAAAIVCSRAGAEPPTRKEVDSLKTPGIKAAAKAKPPAAKKPAVKKTPVIKTADKRANAKKVVSKKVPSNRALKRAVKKPAKRK